MGFEIKAMALLKSRSVSFSDRKTAGTESAPPGKADRSLGRMASRLFSRSKTGSLPEEALFKAVMFRLNDDGDPMKKADWRAKEVWLDSEGRCFVASAGKSSEEDTLCNGAPLTK